MIHEVGLIVMLQQFCDKGIDSTIAAIVLFAFLFLAVINGPVNRLLSGKTAHSKRNSIVVITGCDSGFGLYMSKKMNELGYIVLANMFDN
jgi:hypothetical protein